LPFWNCHCKALSSLASKKNHCQKFALKTIVFHCNPRAYPYQNPTPIIFGKYFQSKRVCKKKCLYPCDRRTKTWVRRKVKVLPHLDIQPPKKKKKSAKEKLFPPHMWPRTCSYLFPSFGGFSPLKLKHFRHLFWVEWSPLRFWKNAANEESALRGKTTPLQSGSLVSKLAPKKANQWAQTSKRVLHFVRQYSRAFAASFGGNPNPF